MQFSASYNAGHGRPPCLFEDTFDRCLEWTPLLHRSEHCVQSPQSPTSQSTGGGCSNVGPSVGPKVGGAVGGSVGSGVGNIVMEQGSVLHMRSSSDGQSLPPYPPCTCTVYPRVCTPWPQDFEQAVQGSQVCSQSIGHGWVLQLLPSMRDGHRAPPPIGHAVFLLMRIWMPVPHGAEHLLHGSQSPTWQSTTGAAVVGEAVGAFDGAGVANVGAAVGACVGHA